jgi:sterol desaturase/sphingolipid hydroxylase (fatty acid hydroxylase superfamily)
MNWRLAESIEGHSGFAFPRPISVLLGNLMALNPIMGTDPSYHDFHHEKNVGNFSSFFTVWDTLFGSNEKYFERKLVDDEVLEVTKNKLKSA